MMWEAARDRVTARGGLVELGQRVTAVERSESGRAVAVETVDSAGAIRRRVCSDVVSSMPLGQLAAALDCPPDIAATAARLTHRDFVTVALVVPFDVGFPDNWIYIHDPEVRVARIQNYGRWSTDMVVAGSTCLGLEYFVNEDDELWQSPDAALIELATAELVSLGLVAATSVHHGAVIRQRRAYPVYHRGYADDVTSIREWVEAVAPNVWPVGRNGMHRYNNQDHSMLTALVAARRIAGTTMSDPWLVSVDDEYGEQPIGGHSARTSTIRAHRSRKFSPTA